MADNAARRSAIQFAHDLRDIRKTNGISIEDVHHESKIPLGLIESFEETGLLDHVIFNRVYLRSFVRTYADVVGVSPELALESLEDALEGTYHRQLAIAHLGYEEPVAQTIAEPPAPEPDQADDELDVRPEPAADIAHAERPTRRRAAPKVIALPSEASTVPAEEPAAVVSEPDWTSQSPPPGTPLARRRRDETGGGQWVYVLAGVLLLGVVAWAAIKLVRESTPEPGTAQSDETGPASLDTTDEPDIPAAPPPVVLGDTMHVTITAANDRVEDIKVKVDDDLRRPYWLDLGESRTFTPTTRIVIERQLDNIGLTLEGVAYPTDRADEEGRIVIDRETARQHLEAAQ